MFLIPVGVAFLALVPPLMVSHQPDNTDSSPQDFCERCKELDKICKTLKECRAGVDSLDCLFLEEEDEVLCDQCEEHNQINGDCSQKLNMFPYFPTQPNQCGKPGAKCDKPSQCCKNLNCKSPLASSNSGGSKCCSPEKQPCLALGDKTCCEPMSCEANPSGKGFLCSATLPVIATQSTPSTTPKSTEVEPDSTPKTQTEESSSQNQGLCELPPTDSNSPPLFQIPPDPDCSSCSKVDPTCCDGQFCDVDANTCRSCTAGLNSQCKSIPGSSSDCCIATLACRIAGTNSDTGTCQSACTNTNNVCITDFNCCRENVKSAPTRFECRSQTTSGEGGRCLQCAKPLQCCRNNDDCCKYPIGYGCFNNICDFSREEEITSTTATTTEGTNSYNEEATQPYDTTDCS